MTVIRDKGSPAMQGAETRGHIQKGLEGDKVPGFDPAAAPMETDAEASGSHDPLPASSGLEPSLTNRDAHASSFANAMRPLNGAVQSRSTGLWWFALIVVVVAMALLLLALWV